MCIGDGHADQFERHSADHDASCGIDDQHILYVDDEEALVFLARRSLQRFGHKVRASTDPLKALEMFRAHPEQFDFVVTDLSMPGMSGLDLARELLKIRPSLPIVLISGSLRPQDVQAAQRIGIHDVIRKPNSIDELAHMLDDILRQPQDGLRVNPPTR